MVTFVSPFQGWFLVLTIPGRRSAAAPLRSALGWFVVAPAGRANQPTFSRGTYLTHLGFSVGHAADTNGPCSHETPPVIFGLGNPCDKRSRRMMYQFLTPKVGGKNLSQVVEPQGGVMTPPDSTRHHSAMKRSPAI